MHESNTPRIDILDSFRCIAILLVILYHYFARFEGDVYPYGMEYADFPLVKYGYLGVQFFFIISGFVIFLSLEKSKGFWEFMVKRMVRLLPALGLCSILTFVFVAVVDAQRLLLEFHKPLSSFLPTLTFIEPTFWKKFFGLEVDYVDGVYWSLAVEFKFYVLSAILFFASRKYFLRNWSLLTLFAMATQILSLESVGLVPYIPGGKALLKLLGAAVFDNYMAFFSLGILFSRLFRGQAVPGLFGAVVFMSMVFQAWVMPEFLAEKVVLTFFVLLFILMVYKPQWLQFLNNKAFKQVGMASYPLYLLHQYIGVILIVYISNSVSLGQFSELVVLPVTAVILLASLLVFHLYEKPVTKVLLSLLFKKREEALPLNVESIITHRFGTGEPLASPVKQSVPHTSIPETQEA